MRPAHCVMQKAVARSSKKKLTTSQKQQKII